MNWMKSHLGWTLAAAVGVVAVTLWLSPRSLPQLLILLLCPAMMFFMMRGMNHGTGSRSHGHQGCGEHGKHPDGAEVMPK